MRAFKIGILIASAILFIGAFSFASDSEQVLSSVNSCQHQKTVNACIKIEDDSSWFSWVTGDSRSAQFHYLDLLELLTSNEDSKNTSSLKPLFK